MGHGCRYPNVDIRIDEHPLSTQSFQLKVLSTQWQTLHPLYCLSAPVMVSPDQLCVRTLFTSAGVVVGIGFFFAFLMMGISWMQNRYTAYSTKQSEEFNTASRSVKPGLIASGIVSAWTWAATLLQSSTVSQSTT